MNKIKISYNTKPFCNNDFEYMCQVFQKLEFNNLELHLGHVIDRVPALNGSRIAQTIKNYNLKNVLVDGGWCDLTVEGDEGIGNIAKQISFMQVLNVDTIRLFFSPCPLDLVTDEKLDIVVYNIHNLTTKYSNVNFLFETHDELGTCAVLVRDLMDAVNSHNNIGLVFDPINFIMGGKDPNTALNALSKYVKHVHLKGLSDGKLCAFGEGIDISDTVIKLFEYTDSFGLEYEGKEDAILGLQKSKVNLMKLVNEV